MKGWMSTFSRIAGQSQSFFEKSGQTAVFFRIWIIGGGKEIG